MDAKGVKSLALFPAKFQKSFWIKNGEWSPDFSIAGHCSRSEPSCLLPPVYDGLVVGYVNLQGILWLWMLVAGIRRSNQGAR